MRCALVQTNPRFGEPCANTDGALRLMEEVRADLYVLPELFNTGYDFRESAELEALAEPAGGPTFQALHGFARARDCFLCYGFAEKAEGIFNSALLVGPRGAEGLYRKVHLFAREKLLFRPGNLGFPVFDLPFGKTGIMICYDWIYPEAARCLALQGARLILHPSNLVTPYCPDAMVTRCLENGLFAATANRVGREDRTGRDLCFIGRSQVVDPRGRILTRMGTGEEGITRVELNPAEADGKRFTELNHLLEDRRPDQYRPPPFSTPPP
ncbi:MAG: nitrilase-related carbon-nitrogen hydrolase [Bacteroidota bacterium]